VIETRLILAAGFAASIRHGSRDGLLAGSRIATTVHKRTRPFRATGVSRAACRRTLSNQSSRSWSQGPGRLFRPDCAVIDASPFTGTADKPHVLLLGQRNGLSTLLSVEADRGAPTFW